MDFALGHVRAELDARDDGQGWVPLTAFEGTGEAAGGVVVRNGQEPDALMCGVVDKLFRRQDPVGDGGVGLWRSTCTGQSTNLSTRCMAVAFPVEASISISAELKRTGPLATDIRWFIWVRKRSIIGSGIIADNGLRRADHAEVGDVGRSPG